MPYTVTSYGSDVAGRPAAAAIDTPRSGNGFSLDAALDHARALLSRGVPNVAIQDGNGRTISGDDLAACCNGEKQLTGDLRAIAV